MPKKAQDRRMIIARTEARIFVKRAGLVELANELQRREDKNRDAVRYGEEPPFGPEAIQQVKDQIIQLVLQYRERIA